MQATPVKENSKEWWEEKYAAKEWLYGKQPSSFLSENIDALSKGETLDIACGEGRNSVYLALKGQTVSAIDFSDTALARAEKLAAESGVKIGLKNKDLDFFLLPIMHYQNIVLVDFHPGPALLKSLARGLAKGGCLLVEGPHVDQLRDKGTALEPFECFKTNELLHSIRELQILYYDERRLEGQPARVRCLARKSAK